MKQAMDRPTLPRKIERYLTVKRRWYYDTPEGGVRSRVVSLLRERSPWWDWGHRVMILVGRAWCGSYDIPQPPTIWYRFVGPKKLEVVRSYDEYRRRIESAEDDWKFMSVRDDGFVFTTGYYQSEGFYGLSRVEVRLLLRYLFRWALTEWFGLRRWLYYKALHSAVHQRKPFSCQAIPSKDSGGYGHWHCQEKRRHAGPHRFNGVRWDENGLIRSDDRRSAATGEEDRG